MTYKTNLGGSDATFSKMMSKGFGIVTVMNAYVLEGLEADDFKNLTPYDFAGVKFAEGQDIVIKQAAEGVDEVKAKVVCRLDTLKVANVTEEGPSKTVTGGQYSNPLIKFGKSARLEMQDALGRAEAIAALCGGVVESNEDTDTSIVGLHFGEDFVGPKTIVGDSFFIDQQSGQQIPVTIIFYQFLPDSIFNLTQDAEGDATVFDMNGDLLTTVIKIADKDGKAITHGMFYSIVENKKITPVYAAAAA